MKLQDKFDDIINLIEHLIAKGEADIPQAIAKELGCNLRLLGDAFQFMTDMTLIKYIRQRRLVYALTNKLQKNLSVEEIAAATMFSLWTEMPSTILSTFLCRRARCLPPTSAPPFC